MPELTLRDGMVIVGSLLILAVMIDAWRRMRQQRNRVRVKLAATAAASADDAPPVDDITSFRELPNGGARVVRRSSDLEQDGDAMDVPADGAEGSAPMSRGAAPTARITPPPRAEAPPAPDPTPPEPEPEHEPQPEESDLAGDDATPLEGMRASDEPVTLDWLEDLPAQDGDAPDDGGELPRENEKVILLHVMARGEPGFAGKDILEILLACDLRFGDMDFFHRHELEAGRGPIQFSVANMLLPGVFDIDNMDAMHTRGLLFFLTLPGPQNMIQAYDYMLETARTVARNLGGEVLDESRSVLTQQSIEHSRQQIRELERRLLAQGA